MASCMMSRCTKKITRAGTNATAAFNDAQHSKDAIDYMKTKLPIMGNYVRQKTEPASSTYVRRMAVHAFLGLAACYITYYYL